MSLFGQLERHPAHIIREDLMRFVVDPHRILASSDFLAAWGLKQLGDNLRHEVVFRKPG